MVVIRCSFATAVNQAVDSEPKSLEQTTLTLEEFWFVLVAKSRNPLDYVPEFSKCEVLHETRDEKGHPVGLTRRLQVKGFEQEFEEVVTFKRPIMITFENNDVSASSFIANIVSVDAEDPNKIYMVSTYDFNRPDLEEGSAEHQDAVRWYHSFGRETVDHVVSLARKLKKEGRLPM